MADLSDFVAHPPNVKRGDISAERRRRLNPNLCRADTGQVGGGNESPPRGW